MKRAESLSWPTSIITRRYFKLNPTPEYQRDAVWSREQKQLLIDSIIRNMDIPKLYFRKLYDDPQYEYEIIDGQQRIRTVYEFHNNEFPLSEKFSDSGLGGLYYRDLPEDIKDAIDLYQFSITVIDEADDDEVRDMFYRLQNGKPLNAAEKRNAVGGNMRDFIANLVNTHPVFQAYRRDNQRFAHEQMLGQCIVLELTGNITDVKSAQLDRLYRSYTDFNPDGVVANRIKRILNYLAKAFKEPTPEFRGRAQFVSLYWLVSQTLDIYTMTGQEGQLRNFFIDFELRRQQNDDKEIGFIRYSEALSRTSDGRERIQYRHDMLIREWLLYAPELSLKDPNRSFTEEQRVAIYRRDNGICQICQQSVEFQDFEVDHIISHSKGGKTTVSNGQATHKACNTSKGGR